MKHYQGEDIEFRLKYKKGETININDWSGFQEIIVYIYTDGCGIIKYSSISREGYNQLMLINPITYSGNIGNEESKKLTPGYLTIEIKGVISSNEVCIEKQLTGIFIRRDFIKNS